MITVEITIREAKSCTAFDGRIMYNAIFPAHVSHRWEPEIFLRGTFDPERLGIVFKGFEYKPDLEVHEG